MAGSRTELSSPWSCYQHFAVILTICEGERQNYANTAIDRFLSVNAHLTFNKIKILEGIVFREFLFTSLPLCHTELRTATITNKSAAYLRDSWAHPA